MSAWNHSAIGRPTVEERPTRVITLRVGRTLHERIRLAAARAKKSMNQYLVEVLAADYAQDETQTQTPTSA